ncbi:hypothetical protein EMIT0P258_30037 [Pseudomonas sp. IT-P258]
MWWLLCRLREQARSHRDYAIPVGAGLLAKAIALTVNISSRVTTPRHSFTFKHWAVRRTRC